MFTNTFAPMVGGLERSVANVHEDLTRLGHFSRVITPVFKGAEQSAGGVLRLPAIKGVGEKDFSIALPTLNLLDHWMEAIEPDVLHSHQPFLLGDTAWRISRRRNTPLVFTHHTLYERYAHYLLVDSERTRQLVIDLTSHYANRCDLVIAPTESIRSILLNRGITVPIEVAPSGIDLELYANGSRERGRSTHRLTANDEVIGHLGRLSQEKNLEYLVDAVVRVLKRRARAKFLLVGDGDRLEWTKTKFAEQGLSERLITPGLLAGDAIADAYAAMDVFAFSSQTDTQGLVLAEAMAAGLPIVALDAPGARDCVQDGKSGQLLASMASRETFATALDELLDSPERLQTLGAAARRAAQAFGRERCARRLLEVYARAIAEFRPPTHEPADLWEQLAARLDVEWTPFWDKVTTIFRAFSGRNEAEVLNEPRLGTQ